MSYPGISIESRCRLPHVCTGHSTSMRAQDCLREILPAQWRRQPWLAPASTDDFVRGSHLLLLLILLLLLLLLKPSLLHLQPDMCCSAGENNAGQLPQSAHLSVDSFGQLGVLALVP
jgi:hypothetical protein